MARGLVHAVLIAFVAAPVVIDAPLRATTSSSAVPPVLERFLSLDDSSPTHYRALRRLDARNGPQRTAWMDVWVEADQAEGFRYIVAAEGGSGYIRSKIFRGSLESEKKLYASGAADRAALTPDNYSFAESASVDGLSTVVVTPRRKDVLLIDGAIFLQPEDGEPLSLACPGPISPALLSGEPCRQLRSDQRSRHPGGRSNPPVRYPFPTEISSVHDI